MTETKTVPETADICADCLQVLANGECFDENGNDIAETIVKAMDSYLGGLEITLGHHRDNCEYCAQAYDESGDSPCDEGYFSWSRCNGCNRPHNAGTRYPATIWVPES